MQALADDLNTPVALAAMHQLANELQKADGSNEVTTRRRALLAGAWLLGLLTQEPEAYFKGNAGEGLSDADIDRLVQERTDARADGAYGRADEIRDELANLGIELEDTREGTRWRRK